LAVTEGHPAGESVPWASGALWWQNPLPPVSEGQAPNEGEVVIGWLVVYVAGVFATLVYQKLCWLPFDWAAAVLAFAWPLVFIIVGVDILRE
jgi:hypothetical protein